MVKKIDHIGIAVKDLQTGIDFCTQILGLSCIKIEEVSGQKVKVAMFPVGNLWLELLEPTSEDSPVAQFIRKRGEGLHHIAYEVEDLADNLKRLEEKGITLVDKEPRRGFQDHLIAFLHPQSTLGVLTELCAFAKI